MCRKLTYIISFILVLSILGKVSGDLMLHWSLDGDAFDLSGNGYDGTVSGMANYAAGQRGLALDFDGTSTYIDLDDRIVEGTWSLAMWLRPRDIPYSSGFYAVMHTDAWTAGTPHIHLRANTSLWNIDVNSGPNISSTTVLEADVWYHCVYTILHEGGTNFAKLYINGVLESEGEGGSVPTYLGPLNFGAWNDTSRHFHGLMDDIRVYDHELSQVEIIDIMQGEIGPYAYGPTPENGGMHFDTWANISWNAGSFAVSHDVYIGENFDAVSEGAEGTFVGNQTDTFLVVGFPGFPIPDGLVPGTTYYWRIDEVNEAEPTSPWKGPIWSFTVPPKTAYNPNLADGTAYVDPNVELSWTPGFGAKFHTIYFGDSFDEISNATEGHSQGTLTYTPGSLELNKTYYWCVDEFDGIETHKGDVWSFTTTILGLGTLTVERWEDIPTTDLDKLKSSPKFPYYPDITEVVPQFSWDGPNIENYGGRIYGWLYVPVTGNYTFWLNTGDQGELWLSTNDDPMNIQLIAKERNSSTLNSWGTGEEQSDPITLHAGNRHYIEAIWKEGSGGDHCQVAWQGPGIPEQTIIPGTNLSPYESHRAYRPNPANCAVDVMLTSILSWSPGETATAHEIYFGTNSVAVRNADTNSSEYRGRTNLGSEIYEPETLEWTNTYYWRVDEVEADGTIHKGNVWRFFTAANSLVIDDFESYNDLDPDDPESNRIFVAWVAAGNAVVGYNVPPFAEQAIVHSGSQSMPFEYGDVSDISEATLTLTSNSDWTVNNLDTLTIWFRGDVDNPPGTLYVILNGNARVDNDDTAATTTMSWTPWNISLQAFADQGVNLTNINSITLGVDIINPISNNEVTLFANLAANGTGHLLFDDIKILMGGATTWVSLKGTVLDVLDGTPAPDPEVIIWDPDVIGGIKANKTSEEGGYSIKLWDLGDYPVTVDANEFIEDDPNVWLLEQTSKRDFVLIRKDTDLRCSVYCFQSSEGYFYTLDGYQTRSDEYKTYLDQKMNIPSEKEALLSNPEHWKYIGVAFCAIDPASDPNLAVYRFSQPDTDIPAYASDVNDLTEGGPWFHWSFPNDEAFYAFPVDENSQPLPGTPDDAIPISRIWDENLNCYLYTIGGDKDTIVWYAYAPPEP